MTEFFKILGIYSSILIAVGTCIVFLFKTIIKIFLDKDLEKFKSDLILENQKTKLTLDKEIEAFKTNLNNEAHKHTKHHDIRLQVIETLIEKIAILDLKLKNLTRAIRSTTNDEILDKKNERDEIIDASKTYNDFLEYFYKKKIYIPIETCPLVDEICQEAFSCLLEYDTKSQWQKIDSTISRDAYLKSLDRATSTIPNIKKKLEDEFRNLIMDNSTKLNST